MELEGGDMFLKEYIVISGMNEFLNMFNSQLAQVHLIKNKRCNLSFHIN